MSPRRFSRMSRRLQSEKFDPFSLPPFSLPLGFEVVKVDKKGPQHHIGSNKQTTPGSFTERLEKIFAKGGMKLGDWSNKLNLPRHFGRHKEWYHQEVLDALESAVAAVANPTPGNVAAAIRDTLMAIADKICDKNSKLYKTLTK